MDELLYYVGLAAVSGVALYVTLGTFNFVYLYFLQGGMNLKNKYGEWAVVTGATDGIGKAYAFELARKGLNIVLVSRTMSKLQDVAKEIEAKHKVTTKVVAFDFTADKEAYGELTRQLEGMDIGVLVNNVGVGYEYPEYFGQVPDDKVDALLRVNMESMTRVTRIVLPGMVERKRGAVVSLASSSGWFPMPLLSMYSATKAYVDFLSQGLAIEYAGKGIHFQCVLPMFVTSKLSKIRKPSMFIPDPDTFARSAVRLIGMVNKTTGFWAHAIQMTFLTSLPEAIRDKLTMDANLSTRKRALKKMEQENKSK